MANNKQNLVSLADRTTEEKREIARMGGIASGKAKREKATMRKTLEMLLEMPDKETGKPNRIETTIGLMNGAKQGKAENYKLMLQLLGEMQEDNNTNVSVDWTPLAELIKITPEEEEENKDA